MLLRDASFASRTVLRDAAEQDDFFFRKGCPILAGSARVGVLTFFLVSSFCFLVPAFCLLVSSFPFLPLPHRTQLVDRGMPFRIVKRLSTPRQRPLPARRHFSPPAPPRSGRFRSYL